MKLGWGKMDAEGAALMMTTIGLGFEIMSAMNSSPWTAENFGADEGRRASCWSYTLQACAINAVMGLGASVLTERWWPIIGTTLVSIYMAHTYHRALQRGMLAGNTGWANSPGGGQ